MTPPAYSEIASEHEISLDVQATVPEKRREPTPSYTPLTPLPSGSNQAERVNEEPATRVTTQTTEPPITTATDTTHLFLVKRCSILPNRPAAWIVKRRDLALSPLAATVLLKNGLITIKDLDIDVPSDDSTGLREPNNPLSGVVVGTMDAVGDLFKSLVVGPVEGGKYVAQKHTRKGSEASSEAHDFDARTTHSTESASERPVILGAKDIAVGTGIGLGRILGAGLKAPMTVTNGFTRGFHNLPKAYGGEVREYEVTDLKSGFETSYKVRERGTAWSAPATN